MHVSIKEIKMSKMYQFTLVLDGVDDQTPNLEDILFEAGCDDTLINYKNGTVYLDFDREDNNLEHLSFLQLKAVESADLGAKIISVTPEHLVNLSDIARKSIYDETSSILICTRRKGHKGFS